MLGVTNLQSCLPFERDELYVFVWIAWTILLGVRNELTCKIHAHLSLTIRQGNVPNFAGEAQPDLRGTCILLIAEHDSSTIQAEI